MILFSVSRFLTVLILLWGLSLPASCERLPGTLSHLSLLHEQVRWELFVHQKDLQKICGVRATDLESVLREQEKIEEHLNRHIRVHSGEELLTGHLAALRAQAPDYWVLTLCYSFQKEPDKLNLEYRFEDTFDGRDQTALVFYDRREGKKDPWIALLHGSRKMAVWTPQGLQNVFLPGAGSAEPFPWLWVVSLAAILWVFPFHSGGIKRERFWRRAA